MARFRDARGVFGIHHLVMGARRVLVANEFASYRQTIAVVIRDLRPYVEVFEVGPESLNGEVIRLCPDLVICSHVTRTVKGRVTNWVEFYPDRKPYSTFCLGAGRKGTSSSPTS